MNSIPRPEYPRPQMVRDGFVNLNGTWEFAFDFGCSGRERNMQEKGSFDKTITVPFCPESKLSGVEYKDFMNAVWYRRSFTVPEDWKGSRTYLHFGAVDYYAEVFVNGKRVGSHTGGYTAFSFDITNFLVEGENTVCLYAEDLNRSGKQPRGKQCGNYYSSGCDYTRTTGIWQTVWLEKVPKYHIDSFRITPDIDAPAVDVALEITAPVVSAKITLKASYQGKPAGAVTVSLTGRSANVHLPLMVKELWEVGNGRLYDLKLTLEADGVTDTVESYFGLRNVTWDNNAMYLNGKPVFQRLVLDQGFYPDGIYTAPSDTDLIHDIELSLACGFNGARLHQKIFEPRFLYHADRMGYLVWGEHGNWGLDIYNGEGIRNFLPEWMEAVQRDYNHPAIVGWCPFNETWDGKQRQDNVVLSAVYQATKAMDPTRPVIDTSGNFHVITDIYDVHDYEQDVARLAEHYAPMAEDGERYETFPDRQHYEGQPYFVSEYGGIFWSNDPNHQGWGYGNAPKTMEEYVDRFVGLATVLLSNPHICALCYTQLTDVEQEQNGCYTYRREKKFPDSYYEKMRAAMSQKAAIEK